MELHNEMQIEFDAVSVNEGFARVAVTAFLAQLNPTLDELEDVKTAVSEAVTNAIIHGYANKEGKVKMYCKVYPGKVWIQVADEGCGIQDVEQAKTPFFTTKPELERSGMGFAFMEAFMTTLEVESNVGKGTIVTMSKLIGQNEGGSEQGEGCEHGYGTMA